MVLALFVLPVVAFTSSKILGKNMIPRLEKKGFTQPLKEEVKEKVYTEKNGDAE